jgi:hypothetical protein
MLQSSSMPQMNPDAIMDMINQSQGASPEQEMGGPPMPPMPPEGMGQDMGGTPPVDPSMMGMDPSMMPPSQPTGGYDDQEAMNMLAKLNLPQSAIDQLLSSMYPSSGQGGMPMGTSPAAEGQSGNMALLAQLIGPLLAQQSQQGMDPSMMGMNPSMIPPPIPPQPPMPPQGMPPMGGPPMPPMPPQGMPPMPPMS